LQVVVVVEDETTPEYPEASSQLTLQTEPTAFALVQVMM
jgi:hypothetical protein